MSTHWEYQDLVATLTVELRGYAFKQDQRVYRCDNMRSEFISVGSIVMSRKLILNYLRLIELTNKQKNRPYHIRYIFKSFILRFIEMLSHINLFNFKVFVLLNSYKTVSWHNDQYRGGPVCIWHSDQYGHQIQPYLCNKGARKCCSDFRDHRRGVLSNYYHFTLCYTHKWCWLLLNVYIIYTAFTLIWCI